VEFLGNMMEKSKSLYLTFQDMVEEPEGSALQKYKRITVGDEGYGFLTRFEVLQFLFSGVQGALGLFLRQKLYRLLFKGMGKRVAIGRAVCFRQPKRISIGTGTVIDDFSRITVAGSDRAAINIGKNVFLGPFSICSCRDSQIHIGENTNIGSHCRIGSMNGTLRIGRYVLVGAYCYIGGGNHAMTNPGEPIAKQGFDSKGGVEIDDNVWLGARVTVLDGVKIGKGAVIGACSLVTKDIPPLSVAYGVPAKVKGIRESSE
jgi:acetyltransferase-like isoleucine patch superfamily enzyme